MRTLKTIAQGGGIQVEIPIALPIGRFLGLPMFCAQGDLITYGKKAVDNSRDPNSDQASIFTRLEPVDKKDPDSHELSAADTITDASQMIIAGTDTTALSTTHLIWTVLAHPPVQAKLEEEVAGLQDGFQDADLEVLPYMNAVIQESLRLYGAVPGSLPRTVPVGGVKAAGYYIPEGFTVSTQGWTLHRDEEYWPNAKS
jgi:cytochrome P450